MKLKNKILVSLCSIAIAMTSTYGIVFNSKKVMAANNEEPAYYKMLESEALKFIPDSSIDPITGRLKEGIIYKVGVNNVYLTSEGIKEYDVINQTENVPMARVINDKPKIEILKDYKFDDRYNIFSNDAILDFDITADETNLYIETSKNTLVSRTYSERSYYETKDRLVWKYRYQKVGWWNIKIWYLAKEYYQEKVIVKTPNEVYQEVKTVSYTIDLTDESTLLAKGVDLLADTIWKDLEVQSRELDIPKPILFMDTILSVGPSLFLQVLSILAEFIPIVDEVKTGYETIFGKDLFTKEHIELGWRIFGGVTLVAGVVAGIFSFGAGTVAVDVASDSITTGKKGAKLLNKTTDMANAVDNTKDAIKVARSVANKVDNVSDTIETAGTFSKKVVKYSKGNVFKNFNPFKRGFIIDEFAGNTKAITKGKKNIVALGRTAPTFDVLNTSTKTLTSVKSMDVTAKTYSNAVDGVKAFKSKILKYIDDADLSKVGNAYKGTTKAAQRLEKGDDFVKTGVDLYVEFGKMTAEQLDVIEDIKKSLPKNFVFNIIEMKF